MSDNVNHPQHYKFENGVEVIDLTEQLSFNLGNVVKYAARAGRKTEDPIEDLKKAKFYLERELERLTPKAEPWTIDRMIDRITEELLNLWDGRTYTWRQWYDLTTIPPGAVVQDKEGDRWRRVGGTDQFEISYGHGGGESFSDWTSAELWMINDQSGYAPFREVEDV